MHDDLDPGVGQQLRERRGIDGVQAVEQDDLGSVRRAGIVDRDLDEAQQRPVAALGHELRVDPEAAALAGDRRYVSDFFSTRQPPILHVAHTLPARGGGWRRRGWQVAWRRRSDITGPAQAGP